VVDCPPDPELAELHLAVLRMQSEAGKHA